MVDSFPKNVDFVRILFTSLLFVDFCIESVDSGFTEAVDTFLISLTSFLKSSCWRYWDVGKHKIDYVTWIPENLHYESADVSFYFQSGTTRHLRKKLLGGANFPSRLRR